MRLLNPRAKAQCRARRLAEAGPNPRTSLTRSRAGAARRPVAERLRRYAAGSCLGQRRRGRSKRLFLLPCSAGQRAVRPRAASQVVGAVAPDDGSLQV